MAGVGGWVRGPVSLQAKLFLFFTISVVLPLGVAGFLSERAVTHALQSQDRDRITLTSPAIVSMYGSRLAAVPEAVSAIGADPELNHDLVTGDDAELESVLRRDLAQHPGTLDFLVVFDPQGKMIASVPGAANYLPGLSPPQPQDLLGGQGSSAQPGARTPGLGTTRTAQPASSMADLLVGKKVLPILSGAPALPVGTLVGGVYLDNGFAQSLAAGTGDDVTIVVDGRAVATSMIGPTRSSAPWRVQVKTAGAPGATTIGGKDVEALASPLVPGLPVTAAALVTSTAMLSGASRRELIASIVVVLALAALGTAALGFSASRAIARPLRELADGADAVAAGRFDARIEVRSRDEVGQLARAFNQMAERLAVQVGELQDSREELKRSLTRFGETLRSTHDLDKILQVVLDTSLDALRARAGLLMVVESPAVGSAAPEHLRVAAARGIGNPGLILPLGDGVAGAVAASGEPVTIPPVVPVGGEPVVPVSGEPVVPVAGEAVAGSGEHGDTPEAPAPVPSPLDPPPPEPSPLEPAFTAGIWVPVVAQGRVFAVLGVLDREDGAPFTSRDLYTVLSLADQAGVAIDNVGLHEEAQRLAITDSMTGIWNHRYFQLRFGQEMDRAGRFHRPFCVLLCDIDNFKRINDTYGHQVGDEVLIEMARRIRSEVRDIDVLARYGGEEFVLMLVETDIEGGFRAAEKIRRRVADEPFGPSRRLPVTISIGVSSFPESGSGTAALLRAADMALYRAKAQGRNRTVISRSPEATVAT